MSAPVAGIEVTWTDDPQDDNDNDYEDDDYDDNDDDYCSLEEKKQEFRPTYSSHGVCNRKMIQLLQEREAERRRRASGNKKGGEEEEEHDLCGAAVSLLQHCDPRSASAGNTTSKGNSKGNSNNMMLADDDTTMVTLATTVAPSMLERDQDCSSILDGGVQLLQEQEDLDEWDTFASQLMDCSSYDDFEREGEPRVIKTATGTTGGASASASPMTLMAAAATKQKQQRKSNKSKTLFRRSTNDTPPPPPGSTTASITAPVGKGGRDLYDDYEQNQTDVMARNFAMLEMEDIDNDLRALAKSPTPTFDNGTHGETTTTTTTTIVSLAPSSSLLLAGDGDDADYSGEYYENYDANDGDDEDEEYFAKSNNSKSSNRHHHQSSWLTDPGSNIKQQQAKASQAIEVIYDPDLFADIGEGRSCWTPASIWPLRKSRSRSYR